MTIHSSIIRIIIRVIGYFRLLASTRTYVLRYVVREDSRNFVPSTRQRSTSIAKIPSLPFLPLKFSRIERHESLSNSSMEKEIRSSLFASIPLHASPPPPSRAPMPRNGTKLTLTIVVSSWLPFLRVDRLR